MNLTAAHQAALAHHLAAHGMRLDGVVERCAGGLANLNYRILVNGRDAVLRRPPPGDLPAGSHDMAREHRVLSALSPALGFVPRPLHLCEDRSVLGAPFQVIEFRAGKVLRGSDCLDAAGSVLVGARLSTMLVDTLAVLHRVDPVRVGLGALGRPQGFFARTAGNWAARARAADEDGATHRDVLAIHAWLERQRTLERAPRLLHGDFKLDNCILDPASLALAAVIDWDMSTRGDPLFDVATLLSYWTEPGDPPCMHRLAQMPTAFPGFLSREQVLQAYAVRTGFPVSDFHALRVLALFKLGVVFLQLHRSRARVAGAATADTDFRRLGREILAWTLACSRQDGL